MTSELEKASRLKERRTATLRARLVSRRGARRRDIPFRASRCCVRYLADSRRARRRRRSAAASRARGSSPRASGVPTARRCAPPRRTRPRRRPPTAPRCPAGWAAPPRTLARTTRTSTSPRALPRTTTARTSARAPASPSGTRGVSTSRTARARPILLEQITAATKTPFDARYWAYHIFRSSWFLGQGAAGLLASAAVGTGAVGNPLSGDGGVRAGVAAGARLFAEAVQVYAQDLAHVNAGTYRAPYDMTELRHRQYDPMFVAKKTARFISEASSTLRKNTRREPTRTLTRTRPRFGWTARCTRTITSRRSTGRRTGGSRGDPRRCTRCPRRRCFSGDRTRCSERRSCRCRSGRGRRERHATERAPSSSSWRAARDGSSRSSGIITPRWTSPDWTSRRFTSRRRATTPSIGRNFAEGKPRRDPIPSRSLPTPRDAGGLARAAGVPLPPFPAAPPRRRRRGARRRPGRAISCRRTRSRCLFRTRRSTR